MTTQSPNMWLTAGWLSGIAVLLAWPTAFVALEIGQCFLPWYVGRSGPQWAPIASVFGIAAFGVPLAAVIAPLGYALFMPANSLRSVVLTEWLGAFVGGTVAAAFSAFWLAWLGASVGLFLSAAYAGACQTPDRRVDSPNEPSGTSGKGGESDPDDG